MTADTDFLLHPIIVFATRQFRMSSSQPMSNANSHGQVHAKSSPPLELVKTLTDKGAVDLLAENGEVAFDAMIQDGILKDIPVIGSLVRIWAIGSSVRDYIFIKKLCRFMRSFEAVSKEETERFRSQVESDSKFRQDVGEKLLLILERADDMKKPELVGRAFAAYLKGVIGYSEFERIASALDRVLMADLGLISKFNHDTTHEAWAGNLLPSGIASMSFIATFGGGSRFYSLTEVGRHIRDVCLAQENGV